MKVLALVFPGMTLLDLRRELACHLAIPMC